jgi:tetratricopeptide (TPR) repeat protein
MRVSQWVIVVALAGVSRPAAAAAQLMGAAKWADSARLMIERASINGDGALLDQAIATLDRVLTVTPGEPMLLHYRGYALYRKGGLLMGARQLAEAKQALEAADEALTESAAKLAWPETYALRAAVLGQIIAADNNNPVTAMRNGMKSGDLMDRAVALGPDNPRVWILKGTGDMFKPKMFGGGMDKAEQSLKKALTLLETDHPAPPRPAWGQLDAHLWLGQVYADMKRKDEARAEYNKVLEIAPNHGWVKYQLLPALDK